jgi:hypothetical protein
VSIPVEPSWIARATSSTSDTTLTAVGPSPAPRPESTSGPRASPSSKTALSTPRDAPEERVLRHEGRPHAEREARAALGIGEPRVLRDRKGFDDESEPVGARGIDRLEGPEPSCVDLFRPNAATERERREHDELVGRVVAVHVERRIGLGVAESLGIAYHLVEAEPLALHAGEHVVRRPVQDADDALHTIPGERVSERTDHRDPSAHGPLEGDVDPGFTSGAENLGAVVREQRLVGGHHGLFPGERVEDVGLRRLQPPHELDDDVHAWLVHDLGRARREPHAAELGHARLREIADRDRHDLDAVTDPRLDLGLPLPKELHHAGTDGPAPEQSDPNRHGRTIAEARPRTARLPLEREDVPA